MHSLLPIQKTFPRKGGWCWKKKNALEKWEITRNQNPERKKRFQWGLHSLHSTEACIKRNSTEEYQSSEKIKCNRVGVIYQTFVKTNPKTCHWYPLNSKRPIRVDLKSRNTASLTLKSWLAFCLQYKMENLTSPNLTFLLDYNLLILLVEHD